MAIGYVGGQVGYFSSAASTTINFALTGGESGASASTPADGDVVVINVCVAAQGTAGLPGLGVTGYTTAVAEGRRDDTNDIVQECLYKRMGATPDTDFTVTLSTVVAGGSVAYTIMVFRGVDATTPLDGVAAVTTGSINNSQFDAPSITSSATAGTNNSILITAGGGAYDSDTDLDYTFPSFTAPAGNTYDLTLSESSGGHSLSSRTCWAVAGMGCKRTLANSTAYDPAAWTHSRGANAADSRQGGQFFLRWDGSYTVPSGTTEARNFVAAAGVATPATATGTAVIGKAPTPAAGVATTSSMVFTATAAVAFTAAAGVATPQATGTGITPANFTAAAGVATPAAMVGIAIVVVPRDFTAAAGVATAHAMTGELLYSLVAAQGFATTTGVTGSSTNAKDMTAAAGVATTTGVTGTGLIPKDATPAAGVATPATMTGTAIHPRDFVAASGAATTATMGGIGLTVEARDFTAAAGAATASTLTSVTIIAVAFMAAAGVANTSGLAGGVGEPAPSVVASRTVTPAARTRTATPAARSLSATPVARTSTATPAARTRTVTPAARTRTAVPVS